MTRERNCGDEGGAVEVRMGGRPTPDGVVFRSVQTTRKRMQNSTPAMDTMGLGECHSDGDPL